MPLSLWKMPSSLSKIASEGDAHTIYSNSISDVNAGLLPRHRQDACATSFTSEMETLYILIFGSSITDYRLPITDYPLPKGD